ncbi:MAG: cell division protein FtsZ [Bacteroidia bacterium]|nr:cell division protein FtsZ [Bacteroidia bacterium]
MDFEQNKVRPSIIKVIGVGGGGSNAVNHMFKHGIKGVEFLVCNTDEQALEISPVPNKIQLGKSLTDGRGAGAIPEIGKNSALENMEDIKRSLGSHTRMVFITAGMGGGTGTGAAPVIAKIARELNILTVAIVTIPFAFEGKKRKIQAEDGVEELKKYVDTLLVISNDKLRETHGNLKIADAFAQADNILSIAARSIAEIISETLHVNVDFADVQTVMKESGVAIMGSATAEGDNRAITAVETALDSPLLNDNNIEGARYILLNITSGKEEITMDEMSLINEYVQEKAGQTADIILGMGLDEKLGNKIAVTIIATGFKTNNQRQKNKPVEKIVYNLSGEIEGRTTTDLITDTGNPLEPVLKDEAEPSEEFKEEELKNSFEGEGIEATGTPDGRIIYSIRNTEDSNTATAVTEQEEPVLIEKTEPETDNQKDINQLESEAETDFTVSHFSYNEISENDLKQFDELLNAEQTESMAKSDTGEVNAVHQEQVQQNENEDKPEPEVIEFTIEILKEQKITEQPDTDSPEQTINENRIESEVKTKIEIESDADETSIEASEENVKNEPVLEASGEDLKSESVPEQPADDPHEDLFRRSRERIIRLRELSITHHQNKNISDLEKEPAYRRKNITLDDVPSSSERKLSRLTLSTDEDKSSGAGFKPNGFLHDKAD